TWRGSCRTARTSCGSGMNRHFQWPKPLKMKKTKNRIFRFRLAKWSGRPFCKFLWITAIHLEGASTWRKTASTLDLPCNLLM
ncbi:MAG: hypothetical protein KJ675_16725, partial [Gammaproteobacteria bacterium]|nr:hypothetical protein [Gammaproteobacteria bacterium]